MLAPSQCRAPEPSLIRLRPAIHPCPARGLLALLWALLLAGCSAWPQPRDAGIAFGLLGDIPYNALEVVALDRLIARMNQEELAFIVHVGDLTSGGGPCTDAWMNARRAQFDRSRHPVLVTPGDNDWTDCHRSGMDPMERLASFRGRFLSGGESIGQRRISVERQKAGAGHGAYPEHMRWTLGHVLFVTINVQGSNDNLGRTPAMDAEHRERSGAVRQWLAESARLVRERDLYAMVVLMQADPEFQRQDDPAGTPPDVYAGLRQQFRDLSGQLARPLVLVHGDTHLYQQNRPLRDAQGKEIGNFLRVEVPGSPFSGWLRGRVHEDRAVPLSFEPGSWD